MVSRDLARGLTFGRLRKNLTYELRSRSTLRSFETLEPRQMMAAAVWHNVLQPLNVSGEPSQAISPIDALLVINEINSRVYSDPRTGRLPVQVAQGSSTAFYDTTCDTFVTPLDALLVINAINTGNHDASWAFANRGGSANGSGSIALSNSCTPKLIEGDSLSTNLVQEILLPDDSSAIRVSFEAPDFDLASQDKIRDAFELVVTDVAGQVLALPYASRRDASLNWTENISTTAGVGTLIDIQPAGSISTAVFNLNGLAANTKVKILARLINNDIDTNSSVVIHRIEVLDSQAARPTGSLAANSPGNSPLALDTRALVDVSGSVRTMYGRTTLLSEPDTLVTELSVVNQSSNAIFGRMLVAIDNLSDPEVGVISPDGFLPGGRPYFILNSNSSVDQSWLSPGVSTLSRELRFANPNHNQFSYTLTTLAEVNSPPSGFTSTPLREVAAGTFYRATIRATDPDDQLLRYVLLTNPEGMTIDASSGVIQWQTSLADVGSHSITVQAIDPFGLSIQQTFAISVVAGLPNRPPMFTSSPTTEAKVAGSFEVSTLKVGDQPIAVAGGLFDGTNFVLATANAGDGDLTVDGEALNIGERPSSDLLFRTGEDIELGFSQLLNPSDRQTMDGLAQGDFNGDGSPDFITSAYAIVNVTGKSTVRQKFISVTLGDQAGGFHSPSTFVLPVAVSDYDHFTELHVGDFNSDGRLDFLGSYYNDQSTSGANAPRILVFPGNGDGTFSSAISTDTVGVRLPQTNTADFNHDGVLDMVAITDDSYRAGILLGNGDGTFGSMNVFADYRNTGTGLYYRSGIGDLDGAHGPDIVLSDWQLQKLYVYLNDGNGNFTRQATLDARQPYWPYGGVGVARPETTWIADFDGDGKSDILYATEQTGNSSQGGLGLYKGVGDGITYTYQDAAKGFQNRPYNVADNHDQIDFNGDGRLDVLLGGASTTNSNTIGVALNKGDGTFDVQIYGLPVADRENTGNGNYANSWVFAGDYNSDGLWDAAVGSTASNSGANFMTAAVSILYADRPGMLAATRLLPSTNSANFTQLTGDVNNDGNLDLLVGDGSRFSTRLGNGDGTFGELFPATDSFYANDPHYATLVDLDHDGNLDLLWSRTQGYQGASQAYMAALGNGDGTFQVTYNLSVPGSFYGAVMIPPADFNSDGYLDFAAYFGSAFSVGTTIDVYLYNPAQRGTFTASYRYIYSSDANPDLGTLTRGDFDNDGLIDLLSVPINNGGNAFRINFFKSHGDGTFAAPTSVDIFQSNTESLVQPKWTDSGDLDNDGKRDFVLASAYGNLSVFLGRGDGTFETPVQYSEGFAFGTDRAVVLTDIDGDGILDISMASERGGGRRGISIRRGLGDGSFAAPEHYFGSGTIGPVTYSDIDNDGVLDMVTSITSNPAYTEVTMGSNPGLADLISVDINGDGHLDSLAVNSVNGHVKLLLGDGDGSFTRQPDLLVGVGAVALSAIQLSDDSQLDIVTANKAARSVSLLTATGNGTFTRRDIVIGEMLTALTAGDLDGNGRADIVVASHSAHAVYLLRNTVSGIADAQAIPTGEAPGQIVIADATGDGFNDIVVGLPGSKRVMVLPGSANGTLSTPLYLQLNASPGDMAAADFNLDGKIDLAVALPDKDQVAILFARGGGRFAQPQTLAVGNYPSAVTIFDSNSDGRPDLLVANRGDDTASLIINRYDPTNVYRYAAVAVDPDGDSVSYDFVQAPGGMILNDVTGEIIWAPTADQLGINQVILRASDGHGGSSTQGFQIDVRPSRTNSAPIIFSTATDTQVASNAYSYTPSAVDPDGDSLRYRLLSGPEGATIDATTGRVTWDARQNALRMNADANAQAGIKIPGAPQFSAPSITVEGMFQFNSLLNNQLLFAQERYSVFSTSATYYLRFVSGGLYASLTTANDTGSLAQEDFGAPFVPQTGRWYHIAFVFDEAANAARILVDGKAIVEYTTTRHLDYNGQAFYIGKFAFANALQGSVSQFRIWNSAHTDAEIQSQINREQPAHTAGLILDYNFEDGDAITVQDRSGNGHQGRRSSGNGWPLPTITAGLAKEQTQNFSIQVEDGKGGVAVQTFGVTIVPTITQSITGQLFQDSNDDGVQSSTEPGVGDGVIYIDSNLNGVRDPGEPFARTSSSGHYTLDGLHKGVATLAVESRAGWTMPPSRQVSVTPFAPSQVDFAATVQEPAQIRGTVHMDSDGNGSAGDLLDVYQSNFANVNGDLSMWSKPIVTNTSSGTRLLGDFFNEAITLTLGAAQPLVAHSALTFTIDLALLRDWRGNNESTPGVVPQLIFEADGVELLRTTFSNNSSIAQAYPAAYPGGSNPARSGALLVNSLINFDTIYHLNFTVLHSDPQATFTIRSTGQSGSASNSSFAVKSTKVVAVEPNAVQWPVYLDRNGNLVRDAGETTAWTDALGNYAFTNLPAGPQQVRLDNLGGWTTITPASATRSVVLATDGLSNGNDFLIASTAQAALQPRFLSTLPDSASARSTYRFSNLAMDPYYRPLTYSLESAPTGMSIDPVSGTLIWTPRLDQVGTHRVIIKAMNDRGGTALQDSTIVVGSPNTAPIVSSIPLDTAAVDQIFQYDLHAQDAEQSNLIYQLHSAPNGATIDAQGHVRWTPMASQLGTQPFIVEVTDGHGGQATQSFNIQVVTSHTNSAPVFAGSIRTTASIDRPFVAQLQAIDADSDHLTFDLLSGPAGLQVSGDGWIHWTPTALQAGQQTVQIRVRDSQGGSAQETVTLNAVSIHSNQSPRIESTAVPFAVAGNLYRYDVVANDADHDPLVYQLTSGPAGLSIDGDHGTVRWQPAIDQFGQSTMVITVADPYGGTVEQSFVITVRSVGGPPGITSTPPTQASIGHSYLYSVLAFDAESDPLTYLLLDHPVGMIIHPTTGEISWTPTADQVGQNNVIVQVSDGLGGFVTQGFAIGVTAGIMNLPPTITNSAPMLASVGQILNYQIEASDPEGTVLSYQLRRGPSGVTVNPTTGLVTWTPTSGQIGQQVITLAAFDSQGAAAILSFEIEVLAANVAPVIQSSPTITVTARNVYRYDVLAVDQNLDPLSYNLLTAPAGMTVDAFGRIRWQTSPADIGTHTARVRVSDPRGGVTEQTMAFSVVADTQAPRVSVIAGNNIVRANSAEVFVQFNLTPFYPTNTVHVTAIDDVGVATLEVTANGKPVSLDANGVAVFNFADWNFGTIQVVARATDAAGNVGTGVKSFAFVPFGDDPAVTQNAHPETAITSPSAGEAVIGFVKIIGSASSDSFKGYTLSVSRADGTHYKLIASGPTAVRNGLLGTWDTTLLENDEYVLRLEVNDDVYGTTVYEQSVGVSGDFKLGNFRLSFADMTIPIGRIPITLARSYDTLRSDREGDFGFGWRMEFRDADLRTSLAKTGLEEFGIYRAFKPGTKVYLTLPGGAREGYTFTPDISILPGFGGGLTVARPRFTPDPGVHNQLLAGSGYLIVNANDELTASGGLPWNPASPDFGGGYTLKQPDGTTYRIDGNTGLLTSAADPNGNVLTFSDAGVTGNGISLQLERDARGRITRAIDLAGKSVVYRYDANGDLRSVTDRDGNTSGYAYRVDRSHYLDKVVDPLGRTGVRANYGADGRLIGILDADGRGPTISYDPDNSLVTTRDSLGNATVSEYDARGLLVTSTNALGGVTRMYYDADENLVSTVDPLGRASRYDYDAEGNVTAATDALGSVMRTAYDARGNAIQSIDPLGRTTRNSFDAANNKTSVVSPGGIITTATYAADGRETSASYAQTFRIEMSYGSGNQVTESLDWNGLRIGSSYDANGLVTGRTTAWITATGTQTSSEATEYDAEGRVISQTDALGAKTQYRYDGMGQLTAVIDPLSKSTTFAYDAVGRQISSTDPTGAQTHYQYDSMGRVIAVTDSLNRTTKTIYDALGRVVMTILPDATASDDDNPRTSSEYDAAGQVTATIDPLGRRTEYGYDLAGRLIATHFADGGISRSEYDAAGQTIAQTDALGRRTVNQFDLDGQPVKVIFADGSSTAFTSDAQGLSRSQTDETGSPTFYAYAEGGQLSSITDALGGITTYTYDQRGKRLTQTDANGHTTRFEYDLVGRETARILPGNQRWETEYDILGRVVKTRDPNNNLVTFEYDAANRLARKLLPGGQSEKYGYNSVGKLTSVMDARGTKTYEYDLLDRLTRVVEPDGQTISYSYDLAGQMTSRTTAAGTVRFEYDQVGRLKRVIDPQDQATQYSYDLAGQLTRTLFPNGVTEDRSYNQRGNLVHIVATGPAGILTDYAYTLDATGRILRVDEPTRNVTYTYDAVHRLLSEVIVAGASQRSIAYSYDSVGNRLALADSVDGTTTYIFDIDDRLISSTHAGETTSYSYDANGNRISANTGSSSSTYQWDAENRLTSAQVNGVSESYRYDAFGNRVAVINSLGIERRMLVDVSRSLPEVLVEYSPAGVVLASHVDGMGPISERSGGATEFLLSDRLGSTRVVLNAAGLPIGTATYSAGGLLLSATGTLDPLAGFAGEPRSNITGWDYLRARYYDPATGVFVSADPFAGLSMRPSSLHKYMYADADPVNRIDPSGLFSLSELLTAIDIQAINIATAYYNYSKTRSAVENAISLVQFLGFMAAVGAASMYTEGSLLENHSNVTRKVAVEHEFSPLLWGTIGKISVGVNTAKGSATAAIKVSGAKTKSANGSSLSIDVSAEYDIIKSKFKSLGIGIGQTFTLAEKRLIDSKNGPKLFSLSILATAPNYGVKNGSDGLEMDAPVKGSLELYLIPGFKFAYELFPGMIHDLFQSIIANAEEQSRNQ